jgi:ribosomal protein L3 glutamine methyltransferase
LTLAELIRRTEKRLRSAGLHYGHGTDNPRDEAAFLVLRGLGLPFDTGLGRTADPEKVEDLVRRRIEERTPAAYLLKEAWLEGARFYVDRRVIVPRSHIAGLLRGGLDTWLRGPVRRVLDLCTGSGCLAILASRNFPNAEIDAVDISKDALEVAARNVGDYGLQDRLTLYRGDLFKPLGGKRYDLIISNPPYVDAEGMAGLPRECRAEPKLAFDGGADGIDIVRRILDDAAAHLTPQGGLLCEVGRCRPQIEDAYPHLPLLWLDTENSEGEVFWIAASDL